MLVPEMKLFNEDFLHVWVFYVVNLVVLGQLKLSDPVMKT